MWCNFRRCNASYGPGLTHCLNIRLPLAAFVLAFLDFIAICFAVSGDIPSENFQIFRVASVLHFVLQGGSSSKLAVDFTAPLFARLVAKLDLMGIVCGSEGTPLLVSKSSGRWSGFFQ